MGGRRGRKTLFRFAAVLLGVAIAAAVGEAMVRLRIVRAFRHTIRDLADLPEPDPERPMRLGECLVVDPNPSIAYRFGPGVHGRLNGFPITTNALGFRDSEVRPRQSRNEIRVVGLGDSTMFGWGVLLQQRYMDRVQADLGTVFGPEWTVEVQVVAVPGWTAVQEVAAFHEHLEQLDPDAVVIQFDPNDLDLGELLYEFDFWDWKRMYLIRAFSLKGDVESRRFLKGGYGRKIPEQYRHLEGREAVQDAYAKLRDRCREKRIRLFAVLPVRPGRNEFLNQSEEDRDRYTRFLELCTRLGIDVIDSNGESDEFERRYYVSPGDPALYIAVDGHLNAIGHAIMSKAISMRLARALAPGRIEEEKLRAGLELLERERAEIAVETRFRGFHHAEDWGGVEVRWSRGESCIRFDREGERLKVQYLVGHPEVSAQNPVEVELFLEGNSVALERHEESGTFTKFFDLSEFEGPVLELCVRVDRTFRESPKGRFLGVAVYPLKFLDGELAR